MQHIHPSIHPSPCMNADLSMYVCMHAGRHIYPFILVCTHACIHTCMPHLVVAEAEDVLVGRLRVHTMRRVDLLPAEKL